MINIGRLSLGSIPRIAGVIIDDKDRKKVKEAIKQGADLFELRIDFFNNTDTKDLLKTIMWIRQKGLPVIATVRSKKEGGRRWLSDERRKEIFQNITPFVDAIDIELSSEKIIKDVIGFARAWNKRIIVSYHNFKETPSDKKLNKIIRGCKRKGADMIKLALMAKGMKDILRLGSLTTRHKNIITLSMGEMGRISRVLFPLIGSLITYGSIGRHSAPGQIPLKVLKREMDLYRVH